MPTNKGIFKGKEIAQYLNNKKVKDLSNNLKNMLEALYGPLDENEYIYCEKIEDFIKPDIVIEYKGIKKYISLKSGRAESIHQEFIKNFILFLRSLGISKKTQQTILLYQYGDGTMDGSGKRRMKYHEMRTWLDERIKEANEELNSDQYIIEQVIERCLVLGNLENAIPIDAIYFGDYNFGNIATIKQIRKHLRRSNWDWMNNLHIGPLQFRPHARYIDKEIKNEKYRNKIDCYWANLSSDIEFISRRYNY